MFQAKRWTWRLSAALAAALGASQDGASGQAPPPRAPAARPTLPPPLPALLDESVFPTQVPGGDTPPVPDGAQPTPGEPAAAGESPTPGTEDLNLPAAEREFGGGGPTEVAEVETVEEEAVESPSATPLVEFLGLEDSQFKIFGWIQNSFTGNPSFPSDHVNFGVNPNYKSNMWMGNQYYTVFERVTRRDRFDIGGRLDFLFGNDWQFNHMLGVFDGAWPSGWFPGIDLAQFYGEMHLPNLGEGGLDVKFGRWYTLHGYEVVPATGRPLLSVPYMFNYGQPFTHWGLMTTWHPTERLVVYNGTPQGWDRFQNANAKWGYMGGLSWTSEDGNLNLTSIYSYSPGLVAREIFAVTNGLVAPVANANNLTANNTNFWTTVLSYKWNERLTQVIETDQGMQRGIPVAGAPRGSFKNGTWFSLGNWFLYQFDEKAKFTGVWRSEVFWDPQGIRTGFADRFYEMTLGLIYKPCEYLWFRPEARYDWSQFTHPYNGGVSSSQFTMAFDVILLY
jgi:hypothetical protein